MLETLDRQHGFTLIEAVIVVSIMAILASLAAPSFRDFVSGQKVKTNAFNLYSDLALARSEAIRRNTNVTVGGTGGSWTNGWTLSAGGAGFKTSDPLGTSVQIAASEASVMFAPSGRITTNVAFTVDISDRHNALDSLKRCIRVETSGLAKSMVGAC